MFAAPEALNWGLVQHVAPAFEFDDLALNVAQSLASASSAAIRGGLSFRNRQIADLTPEIRALAIVERQEALKSADLEEGVRALREKRPPVWPSHQAGR